VRQVLQQFYELSVNMAMEWIKSGQQAGVIPDTVDTEKTADLFVLLAFGMRARSAVTDTFSFSAQDFSAFMKKVLQPDSEQE
jgi:hypothetical protein